MSNLYRIHLPKSSILASWIDSGRFALSMIVAIFVSSSIGQSWQVVVTVIAALTMLVSIFLPIVQWATTLITITSTEISVRNGAFFSSVVTKRWDDCKSWEVSSSFGQARFDLVSVKLGDFGDPTSNIEIAGIPSHVADQLRQQIPSEVGSEALGTVDVIPLPEGKDSSQQPIGEDQFHISYAPLDILIAVTCNYQFFTIIAGLIATGSSLVEKLDTVAILGIFPQFSGVYTASIAIIAAVAVTAIGYSLQYRNLSFMSSGVEISIQHGVLSSRRKTMSIIDVEGIRVTANVVERAMKRYSVSILSSDTPTGHMDSKMTLRSIAKRDLEEIERKLWPHRSSSLRSLEPSFRRLLVNTLFAVAIAIGTFLIAIQLAPSNYLVPIGIAIFVTLLFIIILRTRATRVRQENSYTALTRSMLRYEVLNFSDDALVGHKILAAGNIGDQIRLIYVFMGGRIVWPVVESQVGSLSISSVHT